MVRQPEQGSLSFVWSGTCSKGLHNIDKDSNCITTENHHKFGNMIGRYFFDGKNTKGNIKKQGHISICPSEFGVYKKLEKKSVLEPS